MTSLAEAAVLVVAAVDVAAAVVAAVDVAAAAVVVVDVAGVVASHRRQPLASAAMTSGRLIWKFGIKFWIIFF